MHVCFGRALIGQAFLKLLVAEVLVPFLLQGSGKAAALKAVVEKLQYAAPPAASAGTLNTHAVAEGRSLLAGLSALLAPVPSADSVKELDDIMSAKEGAKLSLRQAVLQSAHYKSLECSLRQTRAAHASLGPLVQKHLETLKGEKVEVMAVKDTWQSFRTGSRISEQGPPVRSKHVWSQLASLLERRREARVRMRSSHKRLPWPCLSLWSPTRPGHHKQRGVEQKSSLWSLGYLCSKAVVDHCTLQVCV